MGMKIHWLLAFSKILWVYRERELHAFGFLLTVATRVLISIEIRPNFLFMLYSKMLLTGRSHFADMPGGIKVLKNIYGQLKKLRCFERFL
jgi:hypothetical protein